MYVGGGAMVKCGCSKGRVAMVVSMGGMYIGGGGVGVHKESGVVIVA